ncbi:MAG: hypothetical protein GY810_06425 [Aureispira sp.]|nr:hypothetical protein [Aureispira sp.]
MTDILDDGIEQNVQELLTDYQKKFTQYTVLFVVVAMLWGIGFAYILEILRDRGGIGFIFLFFGMNLALVLIYAFALIDKPIVLLGYTGITYLTGLGITIALGDEYGNLVTSIFGDWVLGFLCFLCSLLATLFLWILPLQAKKTGLNPAQIVEQQRQTKTRDQARYSVVFPVLALIWGWGFLSVDRYFRDLFGNEAIPFFLVTYGLILLYKWFFENKLTIGTLGRAFRDLAVATILFVILIETLDFSQHSLPYITGFSALGIVAITY